MLIAVECYDKERYTINRRLKQSNNVNEGPWSFKSPATRLFVHKIFILTKKIMDSSQMAVLPTALPCQNVFRLTMNSKVILLYSTQGSVVLPDVIMGPCGDLLRRSIVQVTRHPRALNGCTKETVSYLLLVGNLGVRPIIYIYIYIYICNKQDIYKAVCECV